MRVFIFNVQHISNTYWMSDTVLRILPIIFSCFFFIFYFYFYLLVLNLLCQQPWVILPLIYKWENQRLKALGNFVHHQASSKLKLDTNQCVTFTTSLCSGVVLLLRFYLYPSFSTSFYVLSISSCYHVSFLTSMAEANCVHEAQETAVKCGGWRSYLSLSVQFWALPKKWYLI